MNKVRVRAAPSPTGKVHIGNIRTYLYNYLLVRKYGGANIIRIEDTDQKRKVPQGVEAMIEAYEAYGITFDEGPHVGGLHGPYVQSERKEIYSKYAHELVEKGAAYYCFCTEKRLQEVRSRQQENKERVMYDRACRNLSKEEAQKRVNAGEKYVVRMKFPLAGFTEFNDVIYGKIRINNNEIDDMVLLKSDGLPTYHFAVVVDDHLMQVTHVIRGREYLTQTTRNVFLYNAFGWEQPIWVNVPQILNPDGKGKLSKRHGAMPALAYLRKGYLKEAVINYIMLCGWSPPPEKSNQDDIYSVEELISLFDLTRFQKAGARYDQKKLDYINGKHIRNLSIDKLCSVIISWGENLVLKPFITDKYEDPEPWEASLKQKISKLLPLWKADLNKFKRILELVQERMVLLSDILDSTLFFYEQIKSPELSTVKGLAAYESTVLENAKEKYTEVFNGYNDLSDISQEKWVADVRSTADEFGIKHGDLFMLVRVLICGSEFSPPLFECLQLLGKKEVLARLSQ
ncbi:glutamate--tRNA ligase [Candidatus Dojkabacteria bacterium]|nr:glutamate--tRNA ligase [Candidatus Dojkabacteria bacterium]